MRRAATGAGKSAAGTPQSPKPSPIRLTRRGRIVLVIAVLAIALGMLWLGARVAVAVASGDHVAAPQGRDLAAVAVHEGNDG